MWWQPHYNPDREPVHKKNPEKGFTYNSQRLLTGIWRTSLTRSYGTHDWRNCEWTPHSIASHRFARHAEQATDVFGADHVFEIRGALYLSLSPIRPRLFQNLKKNAPSSRSQLKSTHRDPKSTSIEKRISYRGPSSHEFYFVLPNFGLGSLPDTTGVLNPLPRRPSIPSQRRAPPPPQAHPRFVS